MGVDQVTKRSGRVVPFDRTRIENAIYAAARSVGNGEGRPWAETFSWAVVGILEERFGQNGHTPHVEEVQDIVEEVLIKSGNQRVSKAYILYRHERAQARATQKVLLDADKLVDDYLHRADWRVNENSNMNYSLQGLNSYLASSIAARYWLHKIYPQEVQKAHVEGDLHLHDLGMLSVYCCGWDLQDLLLQGFGGVPAKIESKPPRHLRTALGQLVNFFYTLQGESAGAVAVSNFDTLLAPFVRYDGLDYKAIKQAVQEFVFNINVPTRTGFQTPFTNLTMDLTPPSTLRDQPVVIGGEMQRETYGEFQHEMDLLNRAFAEVMLAGDAKGRVFTFPIPTYNISRDFDWDNPELEPIWAMTARYGIPYFANFVNSDMDPEDARSMCCRLRLDQRELRTRIGGLFAAAPSPDRWWW
jgi:ribonucleoside-triphosphate reductase